MMIDGRLAPEEVAELSSVAELIGADDAADLLSTIESVIRTAEDLTATAERLIAQGVDPYDPILRGDVERADRNRRELARTMARVRLHLEFAPQVRDRIEGALTASQFAWARLTAPKE